MHKPILHRYFYYSVLTTLCLLFLTISYTLRNGGVWPGDYVNSAQEVSELEKSSAHFFGPAQLQRLAEHQLAHNRLAEAKTLALSSLKHDLGNARAILILNMIQLQEGETGQFTELFTLGKKSWPALYYQHMLLLLNRKYALMLEAETQQLKQKYADSQQLEKEISAAKNRIETKKQKNIFNLKREMLDAQQMD
uniref:Uncharacterized protein n=1 Tax=uncultured Thiotrichaceae bacterium TaxID=298394 RepID=A0A6S6UCZ6_9GAMM|nr:MAG: Unknown protein [uncultured Thiotrichaceae bacterium]